MKFDVVYAFTAIGVHTVEANTKNEAGHVFKKLLVDKLELELKDSAMLHNLQTKAHDHSPESLKIERADLLERKKNGLHFGSSRSEPYAN